MAYLIMYAAAVWPLPAQDPFFKRFVPKEHPRFLLTKTNPYGILYPEQRRSSVQLHCRMDAFFYLYRRLHSIEICCIFCKVAWKSNWHRGITVEEKSVAMQGRGEGYGFQIDGIQRIGGVGIRWVCGIDG